ncbi:MAG: response regulator [Cyanobacteria bacterium P01_D01_bin.1]
MKNTEDLLVLADSLVSDKTDHHLSDLQRILLFNALDGVKRSYDDIAANYNYSPRYLRQNIAPKLWQLLSQVLACKVSKSNVRSVLEHRVQVHLKRPVQTKRETVPSAPLETPPMHPAVEPNSDVAAVRQAPASAKGDILLVDDYPENLALLSHVLEEEGHRVRQAINGKVALELVSFTLPDLLLLDVNMPELDGYSVCQKLKDNPTTQDIPVIFVSALDETWDKVKAFSVGGNDYITKPFKMIEVLARVQNQLQLRELQKTLKKQSSQLQSVLLEIATLKAQLQQTAASDASSLSPKTLAATVDVLT